MLVYINVGRCTHRVSIKIGKHREMKEIDQKRKKNKIKSESEKEREIERVRTINGKPNV